VAAVRGGGSIFLKSVAKIQQWLAFFSQKNSLKKTLSKISPKTPKNSLKISTL
jgi:hypothetical protein